MQTGISRKVLSKKHNVSVASFSDGTGEKIIQNVDDLLKHKPDDIVIHVGTNDMTNEVNLLNSVKIRTQNKFPTFHQKQPSPFHR